MSSSEVSEKLSTSPTATQMQFIYEIAFPKDIPRAQHQENASNSIELELKLEVNECDGYCTQG